MIRPLRARHRALVLIVGLAAALILAAGLAARRDVPKIDPLPAGVRAAGDPAPGAAP